MAIFEASMSFLLTAFFVAMAKLLLYRYHCTIL